MVFREGAERKENFRWKCLAKSQPAGQVKEAGLQNPVLTNRGLARECLEPSCIAGERVYRGRNRRVSKHIFTMPVTNNFVLVDTAVIIPAYTEPPIPDYTESLSGIEVKINI